MRCSKNKVIKSVTSALGRTSLELGDYPFYGLFSYRPEWASGSVSYRIGELGKAASKIQGRGIIQYARLMEDIHHVSFTAPGMRRTHNAMSASESQAIIAEDLRGETLTSLTLMSLTSALDLSDLTRLIYLQIYGNHGKESVARGQFRDYLWHGYSVVNLAFFRLLGNAIFLNVPNSRYAWKIPEEALFGVAKVMAKEREVVPEKIAEIKHHSLVGFEFLNALLHSSLFNRIGDPNRFMTVGNIADLLDSELARHRRGFLAWILEHLWMVAQWDRKLRILLATHGRDPNLSKTEKVLEVHMHKVIRMIRAYIPLLERAQK